ncbi:MAG: T9SS C-terminal target domain-containing protein [Ignavibacteriales bacterium]|nr:MAG: T9SS C-terminal target domain-containing protein [Ignavibacteriales bacterium]
MVEQPLYDIVYTGVNENINKPLNFSLSQNFPNPFNPTTKIKYSIPVETGHSAAGGSSLQQVLLKVYDVIGNEVAVLVNEEQPTGEYEVEFSANRLSSGVYFYQLTQGSNIIIKKMVLLR